MWYLLYNVLLLAASPVILLVLLAKRRCRRGLPQRLGLAAEAATSGTFGASIPVIWIHAVSLGEVVAVAPLVRDLRRQYPIARLIVSTVTETGREASNSAWRASLNTGMRPWISRGSSSR